MDIDALAKEKIELQMRLQGIATSNVYGMTFDDRVALERETIEIRKRLNEVSQLILGYETQKVYRNDALSA